MYPEHKKNFEEILNNLARESAVMLQSFGNTQKIDFLTSLSTKQLKRILPLAALGGDSASCTIINDLISARGYHNEL